MVSEIRATFLPPLAAATLYFFLSSPAPKKKRSRYLHYSGRNFSSSDAKLFSLDLVFLFLSGGEEAYMRVRRYASSSQRDCSEHLRVTA